MAHLDLPALEARWGRLLAGFAADPAAARAAFADLARRHAAPDRHYHTLQHVHAVLDAVAWLRGDAPPALPLSAWLHDVVYDTRAADNEVRSAAHAHAVLPALGVPPAVCDEVARLILLTRTHAADPADADGHVLLDADLAVLGAPEAEYDAYAAQIRREYAWVPAADYRAGRGRVLEGFLARPRVYQTPQMFAHAEGRARGNLARELARLRGPGGEAVGRPS